MVYTYVRLGILEMRLCVYVYIFVFVQGIYKCKTENFFKWAFVYVFVLL